jgi:hypothetical protein
MNLSALRHPADSLFWLALAVFVAGVLALSLWSGKVRLSYVGVFERSKRPVAYWAVCLVQLALAAFIASVFVSSLSRP